MKTKYIVWILSIAITANYCYAQEATSRVITGFYSLPVGQRAIVTDSSLYLDAVEYADKTVIVNNVSTIFRTAAPTKVQCGVFSVNGSVLAPTSGGALVIDGPANLQVYQINPNLNEALNSVLYTRTIAEKIKSVPFVAIKVEPTPNLSGPSLLPSNSIVIPDNTIGTVTVILESSTDLVNWTAALPGDYSNTTSKRFFRIRATAK